MCAPVRLRFLGGVCEHETATVVGFNDQKLSLQEQAAYQESDFRLPSLAQLTRGDVDVNTLLGLRKTLLEVIITAMMQASGRRSHEASRIVQLYNSRHSTTALGAPPLVCNEPAHAEDCYSTECCCTHCCERPGFRISPLCRPALAFPASHLAPNEVARLRTPSCTCELRARWRPTSLRADARAMVGPAHARESDSEAAGRPASRRDGRAAVSATRPDRARRSLHSAGPPPHARRSKPQQPFKCRMRQGGRPPSTPLCS